MRFPIKPSLLLGGCLLLIIPACNDSGSSSSWAKDALYEYGVKSLGKDKLEYWQLDDDPVDAIIGRIAFQRLLDRRASENVWVLAPLVQALGFNLLLQGNPTIVQGIDPDGGSSLRDYILVTPGSVIEWYIIRNVLFNQIYGARNKLAFQFFTAVPQALTEVANLLIATRFFFLTTIALLPNFALLHMYSVLDQIDTGLRNQVAAAMLFNAIRIAIYHSDGVQRRVPSRSVDIMRYGVITFVLTQLMLDNLNANFPNGKGTYGITARASPALPLLALGYVCLFWQLRLQPINLFRVGGGFAQSTDPLDIYQLGLVVDRNDDPSDNFRASPAFPMDLYDNTDRWMNASLDSTGLSLQLVDATTPPLAGNPTVVPSSAIVIQSDYATLYIVNADEVTDSTAMPPTPPPFRATMFRHTGDFGAEGDWDADTAPLVGEPLARGN